MNADVDVQYAAATEGLPKREEIRAWVDATLSGRRAEAELTVRIVDEVGRLDLPPLGASVSSIVLLLSREFLKLVILANLIAWPVAYYAMNKWLQNFAYRIKIGLGVFILATLLAFQQCPWV